MLVFFGKFIKKSVKMIFIKVRIDHIMMFIKIKNNDIGFSRIYYFYERKFRLICFIKLRSVCGL